MSLLPSFKQSCLLTAAEEGLGFFFLQNTREAVPKSVCGVDFDGCGAGDKATGVPGSVEQRREMGAGQRFSTTYYKNDTWKHYLLAMFQLLSVCYTVLFTPDSQSLLLETIGWFSFLRLVWF